MQGSIEGELSLIVLEQHARWPSCANQYQSSLPNSLVEAQAEEESPHAFADRVGRRIASVASKGGRVRVAIIAANSSLAAPTVQARHQLAQAAVRAMGLSGELVLTASPHEMGLQDDDLIRHELFALAGKLCDELTGTEISVSVRFPHATERSGLRPSVHKVQSDTDNVASG